MRRGAGYLTTTLLGLLVAITAISVAVAAHDGDLRTRLTGEKEVPGPGDPDATGRAFITFDEGEDTICYLITWQKMQKPSAAHIHLGDRDEAGPVVVTLFDADDDIRRRSAEGCVVVSHELWLDIQENPQKYYVNVHNRKYPSGAIRGQLRDDR